MVDKRKNVVFVMTGACGMTGGVAAVNVQVIEALSDLVETAGLDLTVLSFAETPADRPPFLPASAQFRAFSRRKVALAAAILRYAAARPIFFFDYVRLALPLLPLLPAPSTRTIVFAHGQEYWRDMRWTDRRLLRAASLILTNSHFTLNKMRDVMGDLRIAACPLGLPRQFSLNGGTQHDAPESLVLSDCHGADRLLGDHVLLLVGRMDGRERGKGHDAMLRVLPELVTSFGDVQLVFAGPGDDRGRLAEKACALGVGHAVFIPGRVEPQMLTTLYRRCYAFSMPSRQEGFGLAYLEAMNFGKPCVGCWNDGAEDVIVDGQTGYLVHDPSDGSELLDKLTDLLSNPSRAAEMGRHGFQRLESQFTAQHFRQRLLEHLEPLLNSSAEIAASVSRCAHP